VKNVVLSRNTNQGSSVSTVTWIRFLAGAEILSFRHRLHTGSGAHPTSCQIGTEGSVLGGKAAGAWS